MDRWRPGFELSLVQGLLLLGFLTTKCHWRVMTIRAEVEVEYKLIKTGPTCSTRSAEQAIRLNLDERLVD